MNRQTGTGRLTTPVQNEAATRFEVSPRGLRDRGRDEVGEVSDSRRGQRPAYGRSLRETLRRQVGAEPNLTVAEHRARLAAQGGPTPSLTTVWRWLEDLRAGAQRKANQTGGPDARVGILGIFPR
ncbi:MAG: helix-turn-helix domain-containing protein [Verrucomicrobia bacterium]|nr:helix-turn-helix domain-containing protein [Verrucomicrobiota bacterium]